MRKLKLGKVSFKRSSTFRKYFLSIFSSVFLVLVVLGLSLLIFVANYWKDTNVELLTENVKKLSVTSSGFFELDEENEYINNPTVMLAYSLSLVSNSIDSDLYICDIDGNVILCKDIINSVEPGQSKAYCEKHSGMKVPSNIIKQAIKGNYQVAGEIPELNQDFAIVAGEPIVVNGRPIGIIIGLQSGLGSMYPFVTSIFKMFLFSALLSFLVAFAAVYLVTYSIVKPLRKMSQITKEYATGDFTKRIEVKGNNELAELGNAMNTMAQSLSALEYSRRSFVANVSHELKTPMTTIGGFIDGILDGTISPDEEERYLTIVSNEVKRLARLVSSMLNLSKIEAGELSLNLKKVDISNLIFNTLLSFEQLINKKSIDILGLDTIDSIRVNADEGLLGQVLYNLIDNAVKFTEEGGYIDVHAEQNATVTTVTIKNSGAGVPADEIERIFERFYKIDKSRGLDTKSTGLGLYIVKSIIEMHGGTIEATSELNKYTLFRFTLPND